MQNRDTAQDPVHLAREEQVNEYIDNYNSRERNRGSSSADLNSFSESFFFVNLLIDDALGGEAENIRAVASQPRRRPREPRRRPRMTPEQRAAYEEAERIADMKFYMLQIYKIIKPVVVCICLSILWVKISMAGSDYR